MAKTEHYYTKFEEGNFYHIYNRTVDKQPLFKNDGNYKFFLERYHKYLSSVTELYAYCLLGNHFHILLRVNDALPPPIDTSNKSAHDIVSHQLRKFFQSYAMAFNKQQDRVGTLFQTPFKRAIISDDAYFTQIIYYIHSNPQHHNLVENFMNWRWCSFKEILSDHPNNIQKQKVIDWFGSKDAYRDYHNERRIIDEKVKLEDD